MKKIFLYFKTNAHFVPSTFAEVSTNGSQADTQAHSGGILAKVLAGNGNLGEYLQNIFDLAIVFGGVLAVARIAYAGFMYMTSDVAGTKEDAKIILRNAVIGLLLLLSIVIILKRINPDILNLDITLKRPDVKDTEIDTNKTIINNKGGDGEFDSGGTGIGGPGS